MNLKGTKLNVANISKSAYDERKVVAPENIAREDVVSKGLRTLESSYKENSAKEKVALVKKKSKDFQAMEKLSRG